MKILFLITLLANITLFFWQFNSATSNTIVDNNSADNYQDKQIVLVNELNKKDVEKNLKTPEQINKLDNPTQSKKSKKNDTGQNEAIKSENHNQDALITSWQIDNAINIAWWENLSPSDKNSQSAGLADNGISENKAFNTLIKQPAELKNYCYQVGVFDKLDALETWRELNDIKQTSLRQVNKGKENVSSFMVYYPAAENLAESDKNIQILAEKGIDDYWLFRQGELKGVISLGKFASENRALLLQEELIKKGLNVEIMQRVETETAFYAQITTQNIAFKDTLQISEKLVLSECEINHSEQAVPDSMVSL